MITHWALLLTGLAVIVIGLCMYRNKQNIKKEPDTTGQSLPASMATTSVPPATGGSVMTSAHSNATSCKGCVQNSDCPYWDMNLYSCIGPFPEAERMTNKEQCQRRGGAWKRRGGCNANGRCDCPYPMTDTINPVTGNWTPCDPRPNGPPVCYAPIGMLSGEIRDSRPYQYNYGVTFNGNARPMYVGNASWKPSYSHCHGPRPHFAWEPHYGFERTRVGT